MNNGVVKVVVIKDDCCDPNTDNSYISKVFGSRINISLDVVGCSELSRSIKAIQQDAKLVFIPVLDGCKRDAEKIIKQFRKERNGTPVIAWGDKITPEIQEKLLVAGADHVLDRENAFSRENINYFVYIKSRKN